MKRNLFLSCILVGLFILAYFYQEKNDEKKWESSENQGLLLDPKELGEIVRFRNRKIDVERRNSTYFIKGTNNRIDQNTLNKLFGQLSEIRMRRLLDEGVVNDKNRADFFKDEEDEFIFEFENGKASFLLGKKLEFDQSFYMQVTVKGKRSYIVAFDKSPREGTFQSDGAHRNNLKYRRFKSLFYLDEDYFIDKRLLSSWLDQRPTLLGVSVKSERNRAYTIDFKMGLSKPSAPRELTLDLSVLKDLGKFLSIWKAQSIIELTKTSELQDKVSQVSILSSLESAELVLYKKYQGKIGYYVLNKLDQKVYQIDRNNAEIFFRPLQDYWDLRFFKDEVKEITIIFENSSFDVQLLKVKEFRALSSGVTPNHKTFYELQQFLKTRADQYWEGEIKEEGLKKQFQLKINERLYTLFLKEKKLLIVEGDKSSGLLYNLGKERMLSFEKSDYFYE